MRKKYTKQEKAKIVLELLREEKTAAEIASEYGVHPTMLSQWKKIVLEGMAELFEPEERRIRKLEQQHQEEVDRLYKEIGHLTVQVDFLKKKSAEIELKRRTKRND